MPTQSRGHGTRYRNSRNNRVAAQKNWTFAARALMLVSRRGTILVGVSFRLKGKSHDDGRTLVLFAHIAALRRIDGAAEFAAAAGRPGDGARCAGRLSLVSELVGHGRGRSEIARTRPSNCWPSRKCAIFCTVSAKRCRGGNSQRGPAHAARTIPGANGPRLIFALLTHPAAAFISKVEITAGGPQIEGGIVVGTGNDTDKLESTLGKLEATLLHTGGATKSGTWHKLPSQPGAPTIEWGFHDKYLIVGIGDGSADKIAARTTGDVPEWLSAIKHRLASRRVSMVHYLNVKKVLDIAGPFLGFAARRFWEVSAWIKSTRSPRSADWTNTAASARPGSTSTARQAACLRWWARSRWWPPIWRRSPKTHRWPPPARIDPAQAWSNVLESLRQIDPVPADDLAQNVKQAESVIGFRIQEDFLQTLGDAWCVYNSPGDGGLLLTGLTAVVPVKDHDRLVKSNDSLLKVVRSSNDVSVSPGQPSFTIGEATFQKQKIYWLKPTEGPTPFEIAWCITDSQFIVSLSPQNVRAMLARGSAAGSLSDVPEVSAVLSGDKPALLAYQDTPSMLKLTYPLVQIFTTVGFTAMEQEGIDLDAALLPSLPSILRHTSPATATLSRKRRPALRNSADAADRHVDDRRAADVDVDVHVQSDAVGPTRSRCPRKKAHA